MNERDKIVEELADDLNDYKDDTHGVVGQWQDYEDDEYADKGMSRGDFIDKEYT